MKPTTWHLINSNEHEWRLEQRGQFLVRFDYRDNAIRDVCFRARDLDQASPIIHRLDGSIEREMQFGFGAMQQ